MHVPIELLAQWPALFFSNSGMYVWDGGAAAVYTSCFVCSALAKKPDKSVGNGIELHFVGRRLQ